MKKFLTIAFLLAFNFISISGNAQSTAHSFTFGGQTRNYRVYLPTGFTSATSLPLVLNLHGLGSNSSQQELYTLFDNLADTARCVVVYPDGINGQWNMVVGCTGSNYPCSGVDDVGFISALIDTIHKNYNIDLSRVYSTGMSMGGYMTFRLACELSCKIAAAASVTGLLQEAVPLYAACNPTRKMPVIQIHGTADSTVHYSNPSPQASVASTVTRWKSIDACPSNPVVTNLPDVNTSDGCTATQNYYGLCGDSTLLIQYTINGGAHTWPGASVNTGVTNRDMNATSVIWNFFKRYSTAAGVNFTGLANSYCNTASTVTLSGTPSGGTFTGSGITGNQFNPAVPAALGTHNITYTVTYHGCSYSSVKSVTVFSSSSASISGLNSQYCINAGSTNLSGTPSGGTFSGTGISGNQFNPQAAGIGGPYQIVYQGSSGGCAYSTSQAVTVNPLPNVSIATPASLTCALLNVTLSASSSTGGVTYSWGGGPASATKSVTAPGNYSVTATSPATGCSASTSASVTQNIVSPNVSIASPATLTCSAHTITLSASSGTTGISYNWGGGVVTATYPVSAPGPYTVTVTDPANGCTSSASVSVSQNSSLPTVTLSGNPDTVCLNSGAFTLSGGLPPGGTYSGSGVAGNLFSPSSGTGAHIITYSYTDGNNCSSSGTETIVVRVCTTGFDDIDEQNSLLLYPNPAKDELIIQSDLLSAWSIIPLVRDISGNICKLPCQIMPGLIVLKTTNLSPGFYSVQCRVGEKNKIGKFVKVAW